MFEFQYNGEVIKFEGYPSSLQAMIDANKMFGNLPEGAWFEKELEPGKFKWVLGNYFD